MPQSKKTEEELENNGIEVWKYEEKLKELLEKLRSEQKELAKKRQGRIGKEEDTLLRILSDMIRRGIIKMKKKLKENSNVRERIQTNRGF